ncbi:MAG: prepilin-type N-terminal cleavage/methylation domain-containing protein [Verrucomicrobiota bacterium]
MAGGFGPEAFDGFTLLEVLVACTIMGLVFLGVMQCHIQMSRHAEWSGYSLAAQSLAMAQVEQFKAATWDVRSNPAVDQTTNLPTTVKSILDLPVKGTNVVPATNFISLRTISISTNPPISVKRITVNTVWPFRGKLFTNTVSTYRAPN